MQGREALNALAADFRALPGRDRRAVLAALSAVERSKLTALLACVDDPAGRFERPGESFEAFSPWLRTRLAVAAGDRDAAAEPWRMTAAGRHLLLQSAREMDGAAPAAASGAAVRGSLLEALAALLSPARWAR